MQLTLEKKIFIGVLCIVILVASAGTVYIILNGDDKKEDVASKIFTSEESAASYTDIVGNPVSLEAYLEKLVVVTTWASWSPFTASDLQKLNLLAEEFSTQEVVFLALNRKETKEQAQRFMATLPTYENITFVIDVEDRFYAQTGGYAMPETVVFDEEGAILLHQRGELLVEEIAALLNQEIEKR